MKKFKTLAVSEETYQLLVQAQAKLQQTTRIKQSFDSTLKEILKKYLSQNT